MKIVLFDDATDEQLKHYATVMLGLNLGGNPNIKRTTILSRIAQAHPEKDAIEIDEDDVQPAPVVGASSPPQQRPGAFAGAGTDTVIILIDRQEGKVGGQPVPLSFNGKCMLVPRARWSQIPKAFFEVLKDAVEEQFEALEGGGIATTPTMVPRFPWRLWEAPGEPEDLLKPPPKSGQQVQPAQTRAA